MREMLDKTGVSKLWAASKGLFVPKEAGKGLSENDFSDSYKGKIDGLTESYTFVVNSDEALLAWANAEAGNDYTHVLIKSGTWNMSKPEGINLTTAGTLTVTGEPGNKIVNIATFDGTVYGLTADAIAYTDMHITGVHMHVEQHWTSTTVVVKREVCCFANLRNLTDCYATGNTKYLVSGSNYVHGFKNCEQLSNCTSAALEASLTGNAFFAGFTDCKVLASCYVYANINFFGLYGFYNCEQVSACYAYLSAGNANHVMGFTSCTNVCASAAYLRASSTATGMYQCKCVDSCTIDAAATTARAYDACGYLNTCTAYINGGNRL